MAELLLIDRDQKAIARYLPKLRRCADFIESRRDPKNNLFLAGPAGNWTTPGFERPWDPVAIRRGILRRTCST